MAIKTRITEMFGVETPIVMGGMTGVGYGELVAAVANAGALGFITAHMFESGQALFDEIEKTRKLTDKPFGVNLTLLPSINPIPYDEYREAIIASGIKIVEIAGIGPAPFAAMIIQMAISRGREYEADASAARMLGTGEPLARALERLDASAATIPSEVNPAEASAYIVNPLRGRNVIRLFATHPPVEERIARLRSHAWA